MPILTALKADNYDQINIDQVTIELEEALRKFKKDWKTVDPSKINYLMKLGIVQEVMKVEERKAVRREAALIRAAQAEQHRQEQLLKEAAGQHTPQKNSQQLNNSQVNNRLNNSDLQNLSVNKSFTQTPSPAKGARQGSNFGRGASALGLATEGSKSTHQVNFRGAQGSQPNIS